MYSNIRGEYEQDLSALHDKQIVKLDIETTTACEDLYARYPQFLAYDSVGPSAIKIALNATIYASTNTEYWNKENSDHRSACTFMPANAEDVADAVRIPTRYSHVPFALKGGSHNHAPGFKCCA
ncbi:hypothetical protein AC579_104 [Pseudocercospora musae]|uniref:Uncharacterized protein n=1 Tax=Pseudocercospora musae TaxID=113226 RepID=A0A139IHF5_9PEZI|nr:hypothetical protein AC579_104 [Pseudocercospora musae]